MCGVFLLYVCCRKLYILSTRVRLRDPMLEEGSEKGRHRR